MKYYYTRKEVSEWLRENKLLNHNEIDKMLLKKKTIIKWIPKMGEDYFYIDCLGFIGVSKNLECKFDRWNFEIGNCFRVPEEAKNYRQKLIDLGKTS